MQEERPYLLCTRPVTAAQQQEAEEAGVRLDGIPFIETKELYNEALAEKIKSLAGKELHAVFTSMNAVEAVAHMIVGHRQGSSFQKQDPGQKHLPAVHARWNVYSIGGRTAQLVKELFPASTLRCAASYATELAREIVREKPQGPLVFFGGNIRRKELPEALLGNSLQLEEITVYETLLTPVRTEKKYNGVLFFSPSAVESYFSLNPALPGQYFFAIGQTTAAAIRNFTQQDILFSPTTDKEALLGTALDFFRTKQRT